MAGFDKNSNARLFLWRGEPMVWVASVAFCTMLLMVAVLFYVIAVNGLQTFWPHRLAEVELMNGEALLGEVTAHEHDPTRARTQLKIGNRDVYGLDFRWTDDVEIKHLRYPPAALAIERLEYGNFYGLLRGLKLQGSPAAVEAGRLPAQFAEAVAFTGAAVKKIEKREAQLAAINTEIKSLELAILKDAKQGGDGSASARLRTEIETHKRSFETLLAEINERRQGLAEDSAVVQTIQGEEKLIPLTDIVRYYYPNTMSLPQQLAYYGARIWELLSDDPRESNTEGGLFPAIFGTVMLIFLMGVLSFPLGVLAGIYLREYAREGRLVRLVRIGVNNLAGIPAIVYGIFGLGFFVYGIGAKIDAMFFSYRLPEPTFGTGGMLWASLTLGILTVPVVIVATEEALGAIPNAVRDASFALGATKLQTLTRVLLPLGSPGIMTGFILAMARAAGEVAPLMITGVVKLAPALPIDGAWPFLHLDRKFMHLGFHIYDISCQSPNVEAAKPMVYVTTLLLITIVLTMSSTAIWLRNRMKKKYRLLAI